MYDDDFVHYTYNSKQKKMKDTQKEFVCFAYFECSFLLLKTNLNGFFDVNKTRVTSGYSDASF